MGRKLRGRASEEGDGRRGKAPESIADAALKYPYGPAPNPPREPPFFLKLTEASSGFTRGKGFFLAPVEKQGFR